MGIKLLVADADALVRNEIVEYAQLHTNQFDMIFQAQTGQETLDILHRYKPQLLLMEICFPDRNGLEVMEAAKEAGILPHTVILSDCRDYEECKRAMRLGAEEYFLKPMKPSEVIGRLCEISKESLDWQEGTGKPVGSETNIFVEQALEYMKNHYYERLTLPQVAAKVGISEGYLSTLFTRHLKRCFVDCLNEIRINYACGYLRKTSWKTYEIASKVGFGDAKHFSKMFRRQVGQPPTEYRKSVCEQDTSF